VASVGYRVRDTGPRSRQPAHTALLPQKLDSANSVVVVQSDTKGGLLRIVMDLHDHLSIHIVSTCDQQKASNSIKLGSAWISSTKTTEFVVDMPNSTLQ
jgi:hypothetical protein